ncbi:hypothetical protein KVT40_000303 [Elsinoe batatas]|uniref:Uncharacterized protein n=1 Tax=Elsinoe batatas TaxID=2601811 RepID=A0A8K0LFD1_9PEZI|nr:hypothetical protein KVT40_000303 [Elsinoe batatas]
MQRAPLIASAGTRDNTGTSSRSKPVSRLCHQQGSTPKGSIQAGGNAPISPPYTPDDSPRSTNSSPPTTHPSIPRRHPARNSPSPTPNNSQGTQPGTYHASPSRVLPDNTRGPSTGPVPSFPSTTIAGLAYHHLASEQAGKEAVNPSPSSSGPPRRNPHRTVSVPTLPHTPPSSRQHNPHPIRSVSYSSLSPSTPSSPPAELPGSSPRSATAPFGPHLTGPNGPPLEVNRATWRPEERISGSSLSSLHTTATEWAVIHVQKASGAPKQPQGPMDGYDAGAARDGDVYLLKRLRYDLRGSVSADYSFVGAPEEGEVLAWREEGGEERGTEGERFVLADGGEGIRVPGEGLVRPVGYVSCVGTGGAVTEGVEVYANRAARWRLRAGRWAMEGCLRMCVGHNAKFECGCTVPRLAGRERETVKVWTLEEGDEIEGKLMKDAWDPARGWCGGNEAKVKKQEEEMSCGGMKTIWRKMRGWCRKGSKGDQGEARKAETAAATSPLMARNGAGDHELQLRPARTGSNALTQMGTEDRQLAQTATQDARLGQATSRDVLLSSTRSKQEVDDEITPVPDSSRIDSTRPTPIVKQDAFTKPPHKVTVTTSDRGLKSKMSPQLGVRTENCCTAGCLRAELYARFHDKVCGCDGLGKRISINLCRNPVRTKLGMLNDGCAVLCGKIKDAWVG